MTPNEEVEFTGMAIAIGRLGFALRQTEHALEQAQARVAELEAEEIHKDDET